MLSRFPLLGLVSRSFCLRCPSVVQTGDIQGFVSFFLGRRAPGYTARGLVWPHRGLDHLQGWLMCSCVCVGGSSPPLAQLYLVLVLSDA